MGAGLCHLPLKEWLEEWTAVNLAPPLKGKNTDSNMARGLSHEQDAVVLGVTLVSKQI